MGMVFLHPKKLVRVLVLFVVGLLVLNVLSYVPMLRGTRDAPVHMLNMDGEQNLPALFSTAMLWICAMLTAFIAASQTLRSERRKWGVLSATFLFLGTDEAVSLHERLSGSVHGALDSLGLFGFAWILPYALAIAAKSGWIWCHAAAFSTILTSFSGKSAVLARALSPAGILSG
ncbi:MAG: hypothetical protein U9P12_00870, partial [Verrucomicrobiota bacterium]|nr:hypothetical protein [Verrucomicrobiota bacterium]